MTEKIIVIHKSKPFVLDKCICGCNKEINIKRTDDFLKFFYHGHNRRGLIHPNSIRRGEANNKWKGGRYKQVNGYILILKRDHPYVEKDGYMLEHRLVMEQKLGRYLTKEEHVHHINGNTQDNRLENLELFENQAKHMSHHYKTRIINNKGQFMRSDE